MEEELDPKKIYGWYLEGWIRHLKNGEEDLSGNVYAAAAIALGIADRLDHQQQNRDELRPSRGVFDNVLMLVDDKPLPDVEEV